MSTWSQRKRFVYGGIVIVILLAGIAVPTFILVYTPPSCTDGKMNGDERGVDCGGSCQKLCPDAFLPPVAAWTRFEEVAPSLYNIAAYIINPNTDGEAFGVPYRLALYDDKGILIKEFSSTLTLAPHRNSLAFAGAVNVGKRRPAKALFEFAGIPDWHKHNDRLSSLLVTDKKYTEEDGASSLMVTFKNDSVKSLGRFTVYVVLSDKDGNALGFSKTVIDGMEAGETALAPFTWPLTRDGKVISIEVLPVAE